MVIPDRHLRKVVIPVRHPRKVVIPVTHPLVIKPQVVTKPLVVMVGPPLHRRMVVSLK